MTDEISKMNYNKKEPDNHGQELNIKHPLKCKKISNYLLSNQFYLYLLKSISSNYWSRDFWKSEIRTTLPYKIKCGNKDFR